MKKIIVFGRGTYFHRKFDEAKYEIIAFLDNAVENEEYSEQYHCKVYNPERWMELPDYEIVCMSVYFIQMWKQLMELGVPARRIRFGICMPPYFYEYEEMMFRKGRIEVDDMSLRFIDAQEESYVFSDDEGFRKIVREQLRLNRKEIESIAQFGVQPVSRTFGSERGMPVDRVYIENFLNQHIEDIRGTAMEIASDDYIEKFGTDVQEKLILHVKGWGKNVIQGNFETGEGLTENMVDCLICTQTLQYIYDVKRAISNIHKILRPNGVAFLEGLCVEDLEEGDFEYNDRRYSCTIVARVVKGERK